jgi:hypothetical protein
MADSVLLNPVDQQARTAGQIDTNRLETNAVGALFVHHVFK